MTNVQSVLLGAFLLVPYVVTAAGGPKQEAKFSSTNDGVYSEAQARRGETVFANACSGCHGIDQFNVTFLESWAGNTVGALYEEIYRTMPESRPGSLKPQEYADILAYMLDSGKFPEGKEDLPGNLESLTKILIERRPK
jgi:S-disulfanyl-L-cysteine oxidoreductase SoxD